MDVLTFIANVIGSLAWPVTVGAVVYVLLHNGRKIALFVKSIKYKDIEVTLRDDFEKATTIAEGIRATLPAPKEPAAIAAPLADDELMRIAAIDPGLAVLRSWQKLEAKITQLIQHNGLMRYVTPQKFIQRLLHLEKLTSQDLELYNRLRSIRNEVVHGNDQKRTLSLAEVAEYDSLVDTLVERLEQIRNEPGYVDIDWEAYGARPRTKADENDQPG